MQSVEALIVHLHKGRKAFEILVKFSEMFDVKETAFVSPLPSLSPLPVFSYHYTEC